MYSLPYFKENDPKILLQFLRDHPFAFLTGSKTSREQVATQVPILVEEREDAWYLQGHIMRNTDHHKAFAENPHVLAVFTGPHCYVSASWYSNPRIGSTWNYMSVHVKGKIKWMPEDDLVALMQKLTRRFEDHDQNSPTIYDNLPEKFLNKMMPAIIGFEIKAEKIENVFKLSQNRDEQSYRNIIAQLQKRDSDSVQIAGVMKSRLDKVFPPDTEWDASKFLS